MKVRKLLDQLDQHLTTCGPEDTIYAAAAILSTRGIGALPVCDENEVMVGIISERDVVNAFAQSGGGLRGMRVSRAMSADVVTCKPEDTLEKVETLMRTHGVRHIPVVEQGDVIGVISIRDLLATSHKKPSLKAVD